MNQNNSKAAAILPLYLPWLLATILQSDPVFSFWIAWLGSLFIFYWSILSPSAALRTDLPKYQQIMRPIFLLHIIFAGFMSTTSVFYFLNHLGYQYFERIDPSPFVPDFQTFLIAKCQRLNVLAHAALATGIIYNTPIRPLKIDYKLKQGISIDNFLIKLSIGCFILGIVVKMIPPIFQFTIGLTNIAIISGAFILVKGVLQKKSKLLLVGGGLFITNFISATLTGYKEHILINFIILGCLLFPYYKKIVLIVGIPILYGLFYILPTYAMIIRNQSWSGNLTAEEARSQALETIFSGGNEAEISKTNWEFLTNRLSEIEMFTEFVKSTPEKIDYYGFEILYQSVYSIVPRAFWRDKPITEQLSMERVYAAGVASRLSSVSAKTRPVVDGYLSGGSIGVFLSMLIYGLIAQYLNNRAESLFGGYYLGCLIMFNGLFQPMWRGNNWEFFINSVFWSYILMLIIFNVLKNMGFFEKTSKSSQYNNQNFF